MIYRLGTKGHVKPSELAQEYGVTLRSVQRDLGIIEACGFPLVRDPLGYKFVDCFRFRLPQEKNPALLSRKVTSDFKTPRRGYSFSRLSRKSKRRLP